MGLIGVKVAFDVIMEMIMSRSFGFIKAGGDVDGLLKALEKELDYRGIVRQFCHAYPSSHFGQMDASSDVSKCYVGLADFISDDGDARLRRLYST